MAWAKARPWGCHARGDAVSEEERGARRDVGPAARGALLHRGVEHARRLAQQVARDAHRVAALRGVARGWGLVLGFWKRWRGAVAVGGGGGGGGAGGAGACGGAEGEGVEAARLPHEVAAAEAGVHLGRPGASAQAEARLERVRRGHPCAHLELEHAAQLALLADQRAQPRRERVVAPVEGLEEHQRRHAVLGAPHGQLHDLGQLRRFGRVARQWLLAEHVLAGAQRRRRPLVVQPVEQRDVDGLDRRVVQHRIVVARPLDAPLGRQLRGPRRVARADGHDRGALDHQRGEEKAVRSDLGRPKKAKAHGVRRGLRPVHRDPQQP